MSFGRNLNDSAPFQTAFKMLVRHLKGYEYGKTISDILNSFDSRELVFTFLKTVYDNDFIFTVSSLDFNIK